MDGRGGCVSEAGAESVVALGAGHVLGQQNGGGGGSRIRAFVGGGWFRVDAKNCDCARNSRLGSFWFFRPASLAVCMHTKLGFLLGELSGRCIVIVPDCFFRWNVLCFEKGKPFRSRWFCQPPLFCFVSCGFCLTSAVFFFLGGQQGTEICEDYSWTVWVPPSGLCRLCSRRGREPKEQDSSLRNPHCSRRPLVVVAFRSMAG